MKLLQYTIIAITTTLYSITSYAHVQLLSPPSIINSDYQYTFEDGRCVKDTCDAFCGQSDLNPTITAVQPTNDGYINVKLLISVRHNPYRYRISVHDGGVGTTQGFDNNILLDNIEMDGKEGWVSVPLPKDLKCDPYCVLQLFDYYYFVSCSLFTLVDSTTEETNLITEESSDETDTTYISEIPTITQEEIVYEGDNAVRISMVMSLDYITYLAIGISNNGFMVRSQAVVGSVDGESIDDNNELLVDTWIYTTKEYMLGGKFPELITPTPDDEKIALMSNFTIDYLQDSGLYNHKLEVILRKDTDICGKKGIGGKKIIWSYSSYESPSTELSVHVTKTRGLHPMPIMCKEEFDLEEESPFDNDKSSLPLSDSSSTGSRRKDMLSVELPLVALFVGLFVH